MRTEINILHIVTNLADGGLEKVVYLIVSNCRNKNIKHFIAVLTKQDNFFLKEKFENLGIPVNCFEFDNRFKGFITLTRNIKELYLLAKLFKNKNIDIIHSHDFFPAFISRAGIILSRLLYWYKIKKVYITLHNLFFWLSRLHHLTNSFLSIFTDKIICVSKSVYNYSLSHDKIKKDKYKIIYNGVELEKYQPSYADNLLYRKEFGFEKDDIIIGNIGVLSVRKGQKYLLYMLNEIIKKYPKVKLVIFGSTRIHELEIAEEFYSIIHDNNLENIVHIYKPRDDINKIYNMFNVFVMPSISEGLSLSAIEAMLMERICLFSNIDPFKEMIEVGKNGFLFESENIESLINKLLFILDNYKDLNNIGIKARQLAKVKYNVTRMVNEYENLYLM